MAVPCRRLSRTCPAAPRCRLRPVLRLRYRVRPLVHHNTTTTSSSSNSSSKAVPRVRRKRRRNPARARRTFPRRHSMMSMRHTSSSAARMKTRCVHCFSFFLLGLSSWNWEYSCTNGLGAEKTEAVLIRTMHLLPAGPSQKHQQTAPASTGMPDLPQFHERYDSRKQPPAHLSRGRHRPVVTTPDPDARSGLPHEHQAESHDGRRDRRGEPAGLGHVHRWAVGWPMGQGHSFGEFQPLATTKEIERPCFFWLECC